jgi:4-amino-4-deoxy-L-arabinose transferase-like glycosyltransferase
VTAAPAPRAALPWRAVAIVTAAAFVRLVFAAIIPAFPDETYYWAWSRHLAFGYFDHPPVIAWLVRAGEALVSPLFGSSTSALGVRLGAVISGWIAALATVGIAHRLGGLRGATRAAILITVLPLAAAGLILATPDAPLLAATGVGLYCIVRALEHAPRSRQSLGWWSLAGLALGAAFSSKFTSIFLPVAVTIAVVWRPSLRVRLREPGPYVACAIATLVFLPVLFWNSEHGWIAFVYQLRHGLSAPQGSALLAAWKHEGDFFGGQAALASPIIFIMLAIAVGRSLKRSASDQHFLLALVAALSFGFFVYSALRQRVEPNWPAPAFVPAIVLLATTDWSVTGERWLRAGVVLAAAMSLAIYAQGVAPILPLRPAKDPIARAFGWVDVARAAESSAVATQSRTGHRTWLAGDRYQEASELAFHARDANQPTFALNLAGRPNQYDLWPRFADVAKPGDNLVVVLDESNDTPSPIARLTPYFTAAERGELITLRRGAGEIGRRRLWILTEWKGGGWPPPKSRPSP